MLDFAVKLSYLSRKSAFYIKMAQKVLYEQVKVNPTASFRYGYFNESLNNQMPLHNHPEWELSYIVKASGIRLINGTTEFFESGELILITPNASHCWICNQNKDNDNERIESITIQFSDELLKKIGDFPEMSSVVASFLTSRHSISILKGDKERIISLLEVMHRSDPATQYIKFLEILTLLSKLSESRQITFSNDILYPDSVKSSRIEKVYRHIATNYNRKISLSEIAQVASMCETSFCAFFKQTTRHTFTDFLTEYRIEAAAKLLITTQLAISEICHRVGFNDTPHFNRMFKKLKGCSPKQYQQKIKEPECHHFR